MKKIILTIIGIIICSLNVLGAMCDNETYSLTAPSDLICGNSVKITYSDLGFGALGEVNLDFNGLTVLSGTNPISTLDPSYQGFYTWEVNCSNPGEYNITAFVKEDNNCTLSKTLSFAPVVFDPNLDTSVSILGTALINNTNALNLSLNNTGKGNAINISGSITSQNSATLSLDLVTESLLTNNTITTLTNYTVTPTKCGQDLITFNIQNHYNELGSLMMPTSSSTLMTVIGSDLIIPQIDVSSYSVLENHFVTVNATIKNSGNAIPNNTKILFLCNNTTIYESYLNNSDLEPNEETTVAFNTKLNYSAGNYSISAKLYSTQECDTVNDYKESRMIDIRTCTPNWVCNEWSECVNFQKTCKNWTDSNSCEKLNTEPSAFACTVAPGGGGGGGGSGGGRGGGSGSASVVTPKPTEEPKIIELTVPAIEGHTYSLPEKSLIKFNIENEQHSLTVDSISLTTATFVVQSTPIRFTLTVGAEKYIDLNSDFYYDINVKLNSIYNKTANFTLSKVETINASLDKVNENITIAEQNTTINKTETVKTDKDVKNNGLWVAIVIIAIIAVTAAYFLKKKK